MGVNYLVFCYFKNIGIDIVWPKAFIIYFSLLNCIQYVFRIYFKILQHMIGAYYIIMDAVLLVRHLTNFIIINNTNISVITWFDHGMQSPYYWGTISYIIDINVPITNQSAIEDKWSIYS